MQAPKPSSELEQLQELLIGDEQRALNQLNDRIENTDQRTRDVAEVLSDAIRLSAQDRVLETVLREPIERAIHESIRRDPKEITNLLYPVILPAIRRSIEESLRAFIERIDLLVEQRLSVNSLRWRFEAWRTGTSFTEVMLRNSLRYSVEHLLLIQEGSGLLIKQAHAKDATMADSDAVSAMLSAIESFVRDSFSYEDGEQLNRVTFGGKIIHLAHGPHAMLASVVRGTAPPDYLIRLKELLEDIHHTAPRALRDYKGDPRTLDTIDPLLDNSFERQFVSPKKKKQKERRTSRFPVKVIVVGLSIAALALISIWGFRAYQEYKITQLIATLGQEKGVLVTGYEKTDGHWVIKGLKSEQSAPLRPLVAASSIEMRNIALKFVTYTAAPSQENIERRFEALNGLPEKVTLQKIGSQFVLEGEAPLQWLLKLKSSPLLFKNLNLDRLTVDASAVADYINTEIGLSSSIGVAADDDMIVLTGEISQSKADALRQLIKTLDGHVTIDTEKLDGYR